MIRRIFKRKRQQERPIPLWLEQAIALLRRQHVAVQVVANGVRGDSRVIKSSLVSIHQGLPTLLIGISLSADFEYFETEGVPVLLVPFLDPDRSEDQSRRAGRVWKKRERTIRRWRLDRAVRTFRYATLVRSLLRPVAGRRSKRWTDLRPNDLLINVALADILDQLEPRLVQIHDTVPLPAGIAHVAHAWDQGRHVNLIYDSHECNPELVASFPNSPVYAALASIEQEFIRDAWRIVTVSREIAKILKKHYRLRTLPSVVTNGPSRERDLNAPDLRQVIGVSPQVPLAVYSGWIAPERGLDTVLRAMTTMPDLNLALVVNSGGPQLVSVLKLARTLDVLDRVHLAPYVVPSQITQYLSSADIGLIPRKSGRHLDLSLPTKFREYAHAGLPMVVSDNVAMAAEINRTKIGRVFKAGNVGGLALQVGRVLGSPDRYRSRITDQLLDEYAWETQAGRLKPLYATVLDDTDAAGTDVVVDAFHAARAPRANGLAAEGDSTLAGDGSALPSTQPKYFHVQLGIGRANSAGQATEWAAAVAAHLGLQAQSFAPERPLVSRPKLVVRSSFSLQQAAVELGRVVSQYTYLLIDGFESLFGPLFDNDLEREVDVLRPHLFGIGLVAHGSDVRDPDAHMANISGSYFEQADEEWVDLLREISKRNRSIADRFDGPLFVSTPDLLLDLPTAHWLPVVVDLDRWSQLEAPRMSSRLRVLHQPSRSEPPIKGTDVIHPVLERLAAEGVLDYIRPDGPVAPQEMPELVEQCDVVVDQIRTGSYGVAAVEAMTAGRIVVGNVSKFVRNEIDDEVPIVDAPPADFEAVMRALAQKERADLESLGAAGREYALRWHDGRVSAQVIFERLLKAG